jgi:hypothetical protein
MIGGLTTSAIDALILLSGHICKNTEHEPQQQKNVWHKNEDQRRFDCYFSARHFSAF